MSGKASQIKISEADLQAQIIDLAHLYGWRIAHFRPALTTHGWRTPVSADGKGFPDLCLVKGGNLIFWEVKSGYSPLSPEQDEWLKRLGRVDGVVATIVRVADWEYICKTLSEGSDTRLPKSSWDGEQVRIDHEGMCK